MTATRTNRVKIVFIRLGLTLAILAGLCAVPTGAVKAQASCAITVTSNADSGLGTLRQAIADVCAGGTITFGQSLSGATITLASEIVIPRNLTIDGSSLFHHITISGDGSNRILNNASYTVALKSLIIVNGSATDGGAIYNDGTMSITNCTLSGNTTDGLGGAIFNRGTFSIDRSTLSGNAATGVSGYGGAITNIGTLTVNNSTISGNSSFNNIIIFTNGVAILTNSTLYNNTLSVYNDDRLTLINTILAGAASGYDCMRDSGFTISNSKNNLIQTDAPGNNSCSEIFDTSYILGLDPKLNGLADNGSHTQTHALQPGSPAIDAGDYASCIGAGIDGMDQRAATRKDASGMCDIGAFEVGLYLTPEVISSDPVMGDTLATGPNTLTVVFNKDVDVDTATNPANYLLVNPGVNGSFQTSDCLSGRAGDDVRITVNSVSYDSNTFTSTIHINGGAALRGNSYQLRVCGTTSIMDIASTKLNNGADDTRIDFTVTAATGGRTGGSSTDPNSILPATGFAPGRVTQRPERATDYAGLNIGLEIPAIGVNAPVVGVPQGWDVSWLGDDAGWLNGSAFPTWAGNSVITGHVWDADNRPGLFAGLKDLKYGDAVIIRAFGETYTYEVRETSLVKPGDVKAAFQHEDQPWITLLTCEEFNDTSGVYSSRRLVRAVLMSVEPVEK